MINTVKAGTAVPDAALNQRSPQREAPEQPTAQEAPVRPEPIPAPKSNVRLVIERDSDNAYYVYRLVDRVTGKVIAELPRDQVTELAKAPSYAAGTVVSTKA